jgi:hypothetical protein
MTIEAVDRALSELTGAYTGHHTATLPSSPVSLIHAITAPTAMRMLLTELPEELHAYSLQTMVGVNRALFDAFGGRRSMRSAPPAETALVQEDFGELAAQTVDIGDEHAIKLCDAAITEHALRPDPRYLSAATALTLIRNR